MKLSLADKLRAKGWRKHTTNNELISSVSPQW